MTTVLILEDDPLSVEVLRVLLNDAGYRALESVTAEEAVEVCALHPGRIDLLVADVVLRHSQGPTVTRQLKRIRPHMRILFISGHEKTEVLNRGLLEAEELKSGQSCFLQKPFTREQFLGFIENLLAARESAPPPIEQERISIEEFLREQLQQARTAYEQCPETLRDETQRQYRRALHLFSRFVSRC